MNLFQSASASRPKPLAASIRPRSIDDIVGQQHILKPGSVLRRRVASGRLGSLVLYGPPGTGKTTLARALGATVKKEFRGLHAAHNNVADFKAVTAEAEAKDLVVFVDEVHRLSVTQADALLSQTEEGLFDFISATTGNPFHTLPAALVSRSLILQLEALTPADLEQMVHRALKVLTDEGRTFTIEPGAIERIAARSGGDGRRAINTLEDVLAGQPTNAPAEISLAVVDEVLASSPVNFDRRGDMHYDITSAWIKSLRGSDPDAALYWLARLIHAGEDPRFIARRLLVHASEDVGLADNSAIATAVAALQAVTHVGMPEAGIILAHASLHIARAPKSNSAYRGIHMALDYVKTQPIIPVPAHLRDTHYAGAAKLGHVGYEYPHADPAGWVDQEYAPGIAPGQFYQSDARGGASFEARADQFWEQITGTPTPKTHR